MVFFHQSGDYRHRMDTVLNFGDQEILPRVNSSRRKINLFTSTLRGMSLHGFQEQNLWSILATFFDSLVFWACQIEIPTDRDP